MNNPLDDLAQFVTSPIFSRAPRAHSSGRRELRRQWLDRGVSLIVRPATLEDRVKMLKGERVDSLPIRRKEEKRGGLSKKAWKKLRQSARTANQSAEK